MTTVKVHKSISGSKSNGIGLARGGGKIVTTPYKTNGSSFSVTHDENLYIHQGSEGSPYNSSISCGSIPSAPIGVDFSEDTPTPGGTVRSSSVLPVKPTPQEEEVVCDPLGGVIMAAPSGYYLVKPNYDDIALSYVQFLGTSINNQCIIEVVGNVEALVIKDYKSNCMPSRWAYEEGVRKHVIADKVNIWNCTPFLDSTQYDNFSEFYASDTVAIAHYGYNYEGTTGAGASLGGVATAGDICFFTKNALVVAIHDTDWELFDAPGWDFSNFLGLEGQRGVRWIDGFNKDVSCGDLSLDNVDGGVRFLQHLNYDRYCLLAIDKVEWDTQVALVCQKYADRMAEYEFIAHEDPFDGTEPEDRLALAEIKYLQQAEALSSVAGLTVPEEIPEDVYAVTPLWEALKASDVHYDALTSVKYRRVGWGYAKSESGVWYGCAIVLTKENDGADPYESTLIPYTEPPYVWKTDDPDWYPVVHYRGSGLRAVCTAPQVECYLSGILRPTFEGKFQLFEEQLYVRIKDFYAYDWVCDDVKRTEQGEVVYSFEYTDKDNPHEYGGSTLSTGAFVRTMWVGDTNEFWIQRDKRSNISLTDKKDIRVILEGVRGSDEPPLAENPGDTSYMRESPLLREEESEPEFAFNGAPGDCELRVGVLHIDKASRLQQGSTLNPWQSIMVGSIFYSVSGYTALTYTMPKMLDTTLREWDEPEVAGGGWVKERYWWCKTELWAAIIHPDGYVMARWKVHAAPPDYTSTDTDVYLHTEKVFEATGGQEYLVQFEGDLLPESVEVYCVIQGQDFYMKDDGQGQFQEVPEQIEDIEYCLATSDINYHAGKLHFTFGPGYPDEDSEILVVVRLRSENPLQPIETYQEIAQYEGETQYYNPVQIALDGVHAVCPNLTVSEDGNTAIFSCRTAWLEFSGPQRLTYDDEMVLDTKVTFSSKYGTSGLQVQMLDLTNIVLDEPQLLSYPININDVLGDTLILD